MTITSDSSAPIVVVTGSTGVQGGSVISALEASTRQYRIRGLTRNANKESAQALKKRGVEVVEGDLSKLDGGIRKAVEGAHIVFVLTQFWEHLSKQREYDEATNFFSLLSENPSLKTVIWSGLQDVVGGSNGKYTKVDHFDGKAEITKFGIQTFSQKNIKFVDVEAAFYASNLIAPEFGMTPRKQADGNFAIRLPVKADSKVVVIDTQSDYGLFVQAAIEGDLKGDEILSWGEELTWENLAAQLSEVTGKAVVFQEISPEVYVKEATAVGLPEIAALELSDMLQWFSDFGYYGNKPLPPHSALARVPKNLKQFAESNKEALLKFFS